MTTHARCVRGLDARFCSIRNKGRHEGGSHVRRRGSVGDASLSEIIQFLNDQQVRATYGAVAEVLGVIPRSMAARLTRLFSRHVVASWVVSAATGLPTGYRKDEMHPARLRRAEIITSGIELMKRLTAWKAGPDR
jgi:hypothetical protein